MCDEPHPLLIKDMLNHCVKSNFEEAYKIMSHLWKMGYSAVDIISNIFRVCKNLEMAEYLKLEFIKVIVQFWFTCIRLEHTCFLSKIYLLVHFKNTYLFSSSHHSSFCKKKITLLEHKWMLLFLSSVFNEKYCNMTYFFLTHQQIPNRVHGKTNLKQ